MNNKPTNAPMLGRGVTGREPELSGLRAEADLDVSLVLVSDDTPVMIDLVHLILRKYLPNCYVVGTTSGHRTVALAERLHPDLITTDGSKPDMSGKDLIVRLKADPDLQFIPVMTLFACRGLTQVREVQENAHTILSKSFSPAELVRELHSILSDKQLPPPLEDLGRWKQQMRSRVTLPLFIGYGLQHFEGYYDVRTALYEAERAIRLARRLLPDVIVIHERLWDLSGLTVLERLKRDPRVRDIPALMVSGDYDETFREQALDAGAHSAHDMEDFTTDFPQLIRDAIGAG